jgi:hypothetical protein
LTPAQQSLLRHLLTSIGGSLATHGWMKDSDVSEFVGLGLMIIGAAWGIIDEWWASRKARLAAAAVLASATPLLPPTPPTAQ